MESIWGRAEEEPGLLAQVLYEKTLFKFEDDDEVFDFPEL
jgi:hypothetical protein